MGLLAVLRSACVAAQQKKGHPATGGLNYRADWRALT